jgi:hypothetical protein
MKKQILAMHYPDYLVDFGSQFYLCQAVKAKTSLRGIKQHKILGSRSIVIKVTLVESVQP